MCLIILYATVYIFIIYINTYSIAICFNDFQLYMMSYRIRSIQINNNFIILINIKQEKIALVMS
jgi:hypothetical protein